MGRGWLNCMCAVADEARRPAIMKKFFIVKELKCQNSMPTRAASRRSRMKRNEESGLKESRKESGRAVSVRFFIVELAGKWP